MMTNQNLKEAVLTLGISTAPAFAITVAVPPDHITHHKRKYGDLRPIEQYTWLRDFYLPRAILPFVQRGVGVPELHKDGRIHLHMICWDPDVTNAVGMADLRSCVNNTVAVHTITKGHRDRAKILNCIHFFEKEPVEQWVSYMSKDQTMFTRMPAFFPFIFNDWGPDRPLCEVADLITDFEIDENRLAQKRAQSLAPDHTKRKKIHIGTGDFQLMIY